MRLSGRWCAALCVGLGFFVVIVSTWTLDVDMLSNLEQVRRGEGAKGQVRRSLGRYEVDLWSQERWSQERLLFENVTRFRVHCGQFLNLNNTKQYSLARHLLDGAETPFGRALINTYLPISMSYDRTVLLSEQHSGTTWLTLTLNKPNNVVFTHEIFCCDHVNANFSRAALAVDLYFSYLAVSSVSCQQQPVFGMHMQSNQGWGGRDMVLWLNYFQERRIRIIFLRRMNPLSHFLAKSATANVKPDRVNSSMDKIHETLSCSELRKIDHQAERQLKVFSRASRYADALGIRSFSISYETLTLYDPETFIALYMVIGVKQAMKRKPSEVIFPDSSHVTLDSASKHQKIRLYDYIRNHDEVRTCLNQSTFTVLRICHLYENCTDTDDLRAIPYMIVSNRA